MEVAEWKEQDFSEVPSFLGMLSGNNLSPKTMISKYGYYRSTAILNERQNVNIESTATEKGVETNRP
jgi:hypothetical protein